MEFLDTTYKEDHACQPILLPNSYIKPEIDQDLSLNFRSSKGFYQENYPTLDQFCFTGLSSQYNYSNNTCAPDPCDPYDPFIFPSAKNFDLYEQPQPFDQVNDGSSFLQNSFYLHVDGLLNSPKANPRVLNASDHLNFGKRPVAVSDEGSCVTADNKLLGTEKHFGKKSSASTFTSTKPSKLKKKLKSSKGQWTAEEDR